jgi:ribosomal protein S18 acetylase RimI-like enzyme
VKAFSIRPAVEADAPEIARLQVLVYALPPWSEQDDLAETERWLRGQILRPHAHCLVATVAATVPSESSAEPPRERIVGAITGGRTTYGAALEDWQHHAVPPETGWPQITGRIASIWEFVVHPDYRGQGIGATLLEALLDRFREDRADRVLLRTAGRATAAVSLYRRLGFCPLGIREREDPDAGPWLLTLSDQDPA